MAASGGTFYQVMTADGVSYVDANGNPLDASQIYTIGATASSPDNYSAQTINPGWTFGGYKTSPTGPVQQTNQQLTAADNSWLAGTGITATTPDSGDFFSRNPLAGILLPLAAFAGPAALGAADIGAGGGAAAGAGLGSDALDASYAGLGGATGATSGFTGAGLGVGDVEAGAYAAGGGGIAGVATPPAAGLGAGGAAAAAAGTPAASGGLPSWLSSLTPGQAVGGAGALASLAGAGAGGGAAGTDSSGLSGLLSSLGGLGSAAGSTLPGLLALAYASQQPGADTSQLQGVLGQLQGNQSAYQQSVIAPLQQSQAAGYGALTQNQGLRGVLGSSFGDTDLTNYMTTTNAGIANAGASAAQGGLALQGDLAGNISKIGLQSQQLQNGLYGNAFNLLGKGLTPAAGAGAAGAAGTNPFAALLGGTNLNTLGADGSSLINYLNNAGTNYSTGANPNDPFSTGLGGVYN